MRKVRIIRIIEGFTRDLGLPNLPGWEFYNAARPFPAHETWTGEFVSGIFYGAIDPQADYADEYRKRAEELDADLLVFVARDEVEAWGRAYCQKHGINYDKYEFSDIAKAWLRHAEREEA